MNLDRYIRDASGSPHGRLQVVRSRHLAGLRVVGSGTCTRVEAWHRAEDSTFIRGAATLAALAVAIGRALPAEHRRAIIEHLGGVKPPGGKRA